MPEDQRLALRQQHAAPLVAELEAWLCGERARLSRHNDVAKAIDYLLKRWPAFTRFLDDGKTEVDPDFGTSGLIGGGVGSVVIDGADDEEAETEDRW